MHTIATTTPVASEYPIRPPTVFQPGWPMYTAGGNGLPRNDPMTAPAAVGQQDVAQVVVVAGGRGALDVVHRLGEVVDAERDGRDEQRQRSPTAR